MDFIEFMEGIESWNSYNSWNSKTSYVIWTCSVEPMKLVTDKIDTVQGQ